MSAETPTPPRARPSRVVRTIRIAGVSLLGLLAIGIIGVLIWANTTFAATAAAWDAVRGDDRIVVRDEGDLVVMRPDDTAVPASGDGLVFFAGAKVDPQAYAATFAEVVAEGTTVVIVRPIINLAIVEWRDLSTFTAAAPEVTSWSVGGHSMGGVRACTYAEDDAVVGLVLLGSYCSLGDLSERDDLSAISLTGSRDGLLKRDDADASRAIMPADTEYLELTGVNHAQFGAYGDQPGDAAADISDDEARALISAALTDFFARS